ncbi:MAG: cation:proton antiporter [bacterium]
MNTILSLGFMLLAALVAGKLIHKIKLPSVTAYLLLGILIGPSLGNLISPGILDASGFVSNIVLGIIAFAIGQNFSREIFSKIGRSVLFISIFEAIGAWVFVTLVFAVGLGLPFYVALIFGAISAATAPAATLMVVRETKARGLFTDTLLGVVAFDDAWCLIISAVSIAVAQSIATHMDVSLLRVISHSFIGIGGAFILGGILAWVLATFAKHARTESELLIYTLGFVLLNTGLASYFNLSVLLTNMFLGMMLVNIHNTSFKFFEVLRKTDPPIYLIFFVLAGANLEVNRMLSLGLIGLSYLIFRVVGKVLGASLGGKLAHADRNVRKYIGLGLIPQAGVALGVALSVKAAFPSEIGGMVFTTIVATTVIYELVGPVCTKIALTKAGDISPISE